MQVVEYQLLNPPQDGITRIRFSSISHPDLLLVSSWDSVARLYDTKQNHLLFAANLNNSLLDICYNHDETSCINASIDGYCTLVDFETKQQTKIGRHDDAIRCVEFFNQQHLVITGSWDRSVRIFDLRYSNPVYILDQQSKVYSMDIAQSSSQPNRIVVAGSERHVSLYDLRNPSIPEQRRISSLKHQTRCVKVFPHCVGYCVSSVEGRVSIEYFDPNPVIQRRKFAFKCHRATMQNNTVVYPVNTISFHPTFGTFATGGCDHKVNIWDSNHKKRICELGLYPTSISSVCFNYDGSILAISSSYTYEEGEKHHPPDEIFIRKVKDVEIKPRERVVG